MAPVWDPEAVLKLHPDGIRGDSWQCVGRRTSPGSPKSDKPSGEPQRCKNTIRPCENKTIRNLLAEMAHEMPDEVDHNVLLHLARACLCVDAEPKPHRGRKEASVIYEWTELMCREAEKLRGLSLSVGGVVPQSSRSLASLAADAATAATRHLNSLPGSPASTASTVSPRFAPPPPPYTATAMDGSESADEDRWETETVITSASPRFAPPQEEPSTGYTQVQGVSASTISQRRSSPATTSESTATKTPTSALYLSMANVHDSSGPHQLHAPPSPPDSASSEESFSTMAFPTLPLHHPVPLSLGVIHTSISPTRVAPPLATATTIQTSSASSSSVYPTSPSPPSAFAQAAAVASAYAASSSGTEMGQSRSSTPNNNTMMDRTVTSFAEVPSHFGAIPPPLPTATTILSDSTISSNSFSNGHAPRAILEMPTQRYNRPQQQQQQPANQRQQLQWPRNHSFGSSNPRSLYSSSGSSRNKIDSNPSSIDARISRVAPRCLPDVPPPPLLRPGRDAATSALQTSATATTTTTTAGAALPAATGTSSPASSADAEAMARQIRTCGDALLRETCACTAELAAAKSDLTAVRTELAAVRTELAAELAELRKTAKAAVANTAAAAAAAATAKPEESSSSSPSPAYIAAATPPPALSSPEDMELLANMLKAVLRLLLLPFILLVRAAHDLGHRQRHAPPGSAQQTAPALLYMVLLSTVRSLRHATLGALAGLAASIERAAVEGGNDAAAAPTTASGGGTAERGRTLMCIPHDRRHRRKVSAGKMV